MINFLKETYGGSKHSLYPNKGYCCYIIYDKERNMYYSGMKSYIGEEHPIGKTYFTSSTVRDFRNRFLTNPNLFDITVEYFSNIKEMADAEKRFHIKWNVGKNEKFYNVINATGSFCGKGSLLCKDKEGKVYRISTEEYKIGQHNHVSKDRMLVYIDNQKKLTSIPKSKFDPSSMKTQFQDHILCFDTLLKKNRRIPKEEYDSNVQRYQGITKGKCVGINKKTMEKEILTVGKYSSDDFYFNCASKTVKVIDAQTNEIKQIPIEYYRKNKLEYKHINSKYLNRIDLLLMIKRRVNKEEYDKNPNIFADLSAKKYFVVNDKIFGSWKRLTEHLGVSYYVKKDKIINEYNIEVKEICVAN